MHFTVISLVATTLSPDFAVIVTVPFFIAVTTPSSVTVAILMSDDEKLSIPSAQRLRTALFL